MNKIKNILLVSGAICTMFSCKTNLEQNTVLKGSANFTRYVAIGNSLTAGYADGALSKDGQSNSYPVMLAEQFKLAGGGNFNVPYMNAGGGSDVNGNPRRVLAYVLPCNSINPTLAPILDPKGSTPFNNVAANGPYNLVGVPGARAIDANFGLYSALNPFLQRYCASPGTSTILSEALRNNPTFFTLWLGSNDVLLYALGGAVPPVSAFSPSISDPSSVNAALTQIVDTLVKGGAKGAIANVPDITSIPYFTTIPWNGAVLTQGKADTLNSIYAANGLGSIKWNAGANGFMIVDSSVGAASGFMRHATAADYILITTPGDSLSCGLWGTNPTKPLKDQYVLDNSEVLDIAAATTQYNISIQNLATKYNLAFVDIRSFLKTVKSGLVYNGVSFNTAFVSGGSFSLDGVHPTPRGYALIANEFIKSINTTYKSTLPLVNPIQFNGVIFP
ncbi:MAG TPA: SGNH/GDSL hydrolase family protein [Chitinophagaceae bacterium]|nr:SGNH/GDSL hydrolase family protein [Chitinophagaceae bacterium]